MKSPFRRRKRVKGRPMGNRPEPAEPEVVEWPNEGTGRPSLMGAIRGDGETGAGFGGGMFEDLAAAFEGSRKVKQEEQERQKLLREDDHKQAGSGRDDLDSGKIRIRRAGPVDTDTRDSAGDGTEGSAGAGSGATASEAAGSRSSGSGAAGSGSGGSGSGGSGSGGSGANGSGSAGSSSSTTE